MEYIDGITMKEYLKQRNGALTWKEVVHFATQVLSALDHAHSKGIVHRDVKPQNIMLTVWLCAREKRAMPKSIILMEPSACSTS